LKFDCSAAEPFFIDGGANIGLATIYLKQRFPGARIIAFEPDPQVFQALQRNIEAFELDNVSLKNAGLWSRDGSIAFRADGADGGRLLQKPDAANVTVPTVRLSPFLAGQTVDFLKLDIEGAETEVLAECNGLLRNTSRMFVEYHSYPDQPQTLDLLLKRIAEADMRAYIQHHLTPQQPLYRRRLFTDLDMALNIFAWRPEGAPLQ